tara:strand:- start:45 stop:488 length:444 start_codon:yes stop_codon:yes gene_type:complete
VLDNIKELQDKFQVTEFITKNKNNKSALKKYLKFRLDLLKEEVDETLDAYYKKDGVEVLDGLIDTIVVALGTLEAFQCNTTKAWKNIHNSNMSKTPGINLVRSNPFNMPDMVKGKNFKKPELKNDTGLLKNTLEETTKQLVLDGMQS